MMKCILLLFMGLHMESKSSMILGFQMQRNNTLYSQDNGRLHVANTHLLTPFKSSGGALPLIFCIHVRSGPTY